jgi:hypothetical protein
MDQFYFDTNNLRVINQIMTKKPTKIELIKIDISQSGNSITTNSMKFVGEIGVIFNTKKDFEPLNLKDYKDVRVLINSEDNEPFLDAGTTRISQLTDFKNNLSKVSGRNITKL